MRRHRGAAGEDLLAQETGGPRRTRRSGAAEIGAWLHIGESGDVTVYTGKVEVGQNARTSLTQAVVEELHAPVASVHMVMADTDLTPFDIGTMGSMTTPRMWPQIRQAAAAAREMLLDLAAQKWNRPGDAEGGGRQGLGGHAVAGFATDRATAHADDSSGVALAQLRLKTAGTPPPRSSGTRLSPRVQAYVRFEAAGHAVQQGAVRHVRRDADSLDASAAERCRDAGGARGRSCGGGIDDTAAKAVAALKAEWKPVTAEADFRTFQYFAAKRRANPRI